MVGGQVEEDEDDPAAICAMTKEGIGGAGIGAESSERGAIEECRMVGEETIEGGEFVDDVGRGVPGEAGSLVDEDFFGGEPFDAAGKPEAAVDAGQCTKPVSEERPGATAHGETFVVMGFAVMDVGS